MTLIFTTRHDLFEFFKIKVKQNRIDNNFSKQCPISTIDVIVICIPNRSEISKIIVNLDHEQRCNLRTTRKASAYTSNHVSFFIKLKLFDRFDSKGGADNNLLVIINFVHVQSQKYANMNLSVYRIRFLFCSSIYNQSFI